MSAREKEREMNRERNIFNVMLLIPSFSIYYFIELSELRCACPSNEVKMNFIDCQKNLESELESRAQDIMNIADEEVDTWWHLNQLKTIGTYEPSYNIGLLDCLSTYRKVSQLHEKKES